MRPSDVLKLLASTIAARLPVLLTGAPGVGKSDVVAQAAAAAGANLLVSHPAVEDPTDPKGLPAIASDGESARWLPYGILRSAMTATRPTVWLLDDLGQASPSVQAAYMQLLLARRVGEHALSDSVVFVAATNRRVDRAGVAGLLEPVKSRFACIVEVDAHIDDWSNWALDHDVPALLLAFLRGIRPDLLSAFSPSADLTNSPTPRTWAHAGKLLNLNLPPSVMSHALSGAVGAPAAGELLAFMAMARELPSLDAIMLDPDGAPLPTRPDALYAVATGLATRAGGGRFAPIARYAERLVEAGRGEFAALLLRDATRRFPAVASSPEFIRLACGPLGEIIGGVAT